MRGAAYARMKPVLIVLYELGIAMENSLKNKKILIVGGNKGIGLSKKYQHHEKEDEQCDMHTQTLFPATVIISSGVNIC